MNIEVNSKSKAFATDTIEIKAPVEKVYALIYNMKQWPDWLNGISTVNISGEPAEGLTFRWKADGYSIQSTIHTVKSNSEIGWTGKIWWIKAVHNWQFESLSDGNTRVNVSESFSGLGAALMKGTLVKSLKKDLHALKTRSEHIERDI